MKPNLLTTIPAASLLVILGAWCEAVPGEADARLWIQDTLKEDRTCGPITGLVFSADGKTLFAACWGDSTVRFWDVARRKNTRILHHAPSATVLRGMALSPDGKLVASCGSNKKVYLWNAISGDYLATLKSNDEVYAVVFGPDSKTLTAMEDKGVRLWDVEKRKERRFKDVRASAVTVYPSVKRPLLVVGRGIRDEDFTLVDAVTFHPVLDGGGHRYGVGRVAMNRDETMLASASHLHLDCTVRLWDRTSGENTATFKCPNDSIECLAFSPDGKLLAVGYRKSVSPFGFGWRLYEVPSGKVLADEELMVMSLAFSPDGKLLATGTGNSIVLWTIPAAWRKKDKDAHAPAPKKKDAR